MACMGGTNVKEAKYKPGKPPSGRSGRVAPEIQKHRTIGLQFCPHVNEHTGGCGHPHVFVCMLCRANCYVSNEKVSASGLASLRDAIIVADTAMAVLWPFLSDDKKSADSPHIDSKEMSALVSIAELINKGIIDPLTRLAEAEHPDYLEWIDLSPVDAIGVWLHFMTHCDSHQIKGAAIQEDDCRKVLKAAKENRAPFSRRRTSSSHMSQADSSDAPN